MLRTKPVSSAREASVLNHWAICLQPSHREIKVVQLEPRFIMSDFLSLYYLFLCRILRIIYLCKDVFQQWSVLGSNNSFLTLPGISFRSYRMKDSGPTPDPQCPYLWGNFKSQATIPYALLAGHLWIEGFYHLSPGLMTFFEWFTEFMESLCLWLLTY